MKKNQHKAILLVIFSLFLISACQKSASKKNKTEADPRDSLDSIEQPYIDTLHLKQGDVPEGWEKVSLDKGYYIAFPKKPWKRILYKKKRIEYSYPKKNYDFYVSITDLAEEPAFKENREQRNVFYDAVLKDLLTDMTDSDEKGEIPEIVKREDIMVLNIYEGMRVELEAIDVHVFIDCFAMGKRLYTISFLIWEEETPAVLQAKERFFYSFGKELHIE